jgi:DNA-binding transcriptional MerR regulator
MEQAASQAAVNAIAALQRKVKALQDEGATLAAEKALLEEESRTRRAAFEEHELALREATAKAEQMLKDVAAAVQENEEAFDENRRLKSEIGSLEKDIRAERSAERSLKGSAKQLRAQASRLSTLVDEYECLLAQFLGLPPHRSFLTDDEVTAILSRRDNPDLILPEFGPILSELGQMPPDISSQDMTTKEETAHALAHAMSAVTDLNSHIRCIELQMSDPSAPKQDQAEIHRLSSTMVLISDVIIQFHFD